MNFLPLGEKKELALERSKKIILIVWVLFLFFLFCLVLALLFLNTYFKIKVKSENILLNSAKKEFNSSEIAKFKDEIKEANLNLKKLSSFYRKKIYYSDILKNVSESIPESIYLNSLSISLSFVKKGGKIIDISLSGFSPTREKLLNFRKNLENNSYFYKVYFPPSDWIKAEDINFSATFRLNNKEN